jgi:hypothetical protein
MFYSSTNHSFMCGVAGAWETCNGLLYSNTSAGGAINACTTACGALGVAPIPANYCKAGRVIRMTARGTWGDTSSAPTLQFEARYGTNATRTSDTLLGAASPAFSVAAINQSALPWSADITIICFSTTSMNVAGVITFENDATTTNNNLTVQMVATTTNSLTTTGAANLYLFPLWGTSNASNTITASQFIVTGY